MAHSCPLPSIIKLESLGSDRQRTRPSTVSVWRSTQIPFPRGRSTLFDTRARSILGTKSGRKAYSVYMCFEIPDRGVLERRQALDEEIMADETAADGAGGGARGHFDVRELLKAGSNGFYVR